MESDIPTSNGEQYVEERLIVGLFTGSLLQHKDLLDMLEDVDGRMVKEKTLLHVAVGLGRADWVEELLARGADPEITDDAHQNALSSADEMVRRFPEDVDRSKVLNLVTLVHRRDQVVLRRLEVSSSRSTDRVAPAAIPERDIESLKSSVDSVRGEMKSLVHQLRSSLEELKAQVCGRDALLHCMEEAVTSTAEDITSIKFGLGGEASLSQPTSNPARTRRECVDAMLRRTTVVYGSGGDRMCRLYERLYDGDDFTAYVIKYLSGDDRARVMVDFSSDRIGAMKGKVVFLDGNMGNGCEWRSFCDFESDTVYLGALVRSGDREKFVSSRLAWALSQLSLKLVYDNEGRPYGKGDVEQEREWMRAIEEVKEERKKKGGGLDWYINYALDMRTQLAKVNYLASAVLQIIAYNGSTDGRAILQQQAPRLLRLFSNNVMGTLQAKTRR